MSTLSIAALIGLFIVLCFQGKDFFRIDWDFLSSVVCYTIIIKVIAVFLIGVNPKLFRMINPVDLFFVYWEDLVFVIIPYLFIKNSKTNKSKNIRIGVFALLSIIFMLGHLYQGPRGIISIIFPFLSMELGKKKGFGTSILTHILFDLISYFVFYLWISIFSIRLF